MAGLFERIKSVVRKLKLPKLPFFQKEPLPEEETTEVEELKKPVERATYLQEAEIVTLIRRAARKRVLVKILYSNVWRLAEPYSFRQGRFGLLFFAHDLARNGTRSYYVHRTQEIQMTDIPFNPRWMVEL